MESPEKVTAAKKNAKRVFLICLLIAIPASIYFIFFAFGDDHNVSGHGYAAHIIGVILAFLSAFLFMGITFFSSRSGHDEQPNYRELVEQQKQSDKNR
jgi:O-antigen/teichoic acid export membrane protein